LEASTREALAALGEAAEVEKVEDVLSMAQAGVLRTPALAIDGKLVLQGRVPGVRELVTILTKARAPASPSHPGA
jgi:hypothetical protein